MTDFELVIAGGGLAGASLACAVGDIAGRIAVVEPFAADDDRQPSFDERTIALTLASKRVFEGLGIWDSVRERACPIESIHVSDRGHFGAARLHARDAGQAALGYVVPTRPLGEALSRRMSAHAGITVFCPASGERIERREGAVNLFLDDGSVLSAPLLVLADGGRSSLGAQAGLALTTRPYPQRALVAIVAVDRDHGNRAFERFTEHGPLALLPMTGRRMALAWTLPRERAESLAACAETDFLLALQTEFGGRCGRFERAGSRRVYPLSLGGLSRPAGGRVIAVGNAAHIVHPVAGQGFNLGLRDVAELADLIAECAHAGVDPGSAAVVDRYVRARRGQARRVGLFTDGLISLFTARSPGLGVLRGLGLGLVDVLPPVKRFFLSRTMGQSGRLPRLARGLPPGEPR
jgi:2-octaprenyl-6-methoxyphenol hydroxylase